MADSDSDFERDLEAEADIARERQEGEEPEHPTPPPSDAGGGASAAGPSRQQGRKRRAVAHSDDEEEEEGEEEEDYPHSEDESERGRAGQRFRRHVHQDTDDDEDDGGAIDLDQFGGASSASFPLHQGLEHVPGWAPLIMGEGIDPVPPTFRTALPDTWTQWSGAGPFADGRKIRPARVLRVGFVAAWQMQKDAEYVGDIETQSDESAQARTIATCALMGMLTMGTAKGFVCSENHAELTQARAADTEEDDLEKIRQKLNGKLKSYVYCPNRNSTNPAEREEVAQQFCWGLCYSYDEEEKFNGIHYYMLIFDKSFSNDQLVRALIDENAEMKRAGQINSMAEQQRNQRMERQNKLQRVQMSDDDLGKSACLKWKGICDNQDWLLMLDAVGGKTPGQEGRPFYTDIQHDTPAGCQIKDFKRDPEFGGRNPIGPTVSHNHKRFEEPGPGKPGINASIAGMLDAKGKPLGIHQSLRDPRDWYDAQGNFEPPEHVRNNGWFYICHDPSVTNLFKAPLPQKMHGSVEPAEILLRQFWDLNKDTSPILKKAQERGKHTFEENRDAILALFHRDIDTVDPDQARMSRAVRKTEMLDIDSVDKSAAEEAHIEHRAYGKTSTEKHGEMWVLSPRQIIADIAQEQEKVHSMVQEHDKRRRADLRNRAYARHHMMQPEAFDRKEETRKRQRDHAEATDAAVRLGLQRVAHAFERKKARKMIPPGWYDVCHTGLRDALKEAGDFAGKCAAKCEAGTSKGGRKVNPENPDAGLGTANIGQAHGQSYVAMDFTPFGQWRCFLMHLFSAGVRIQGSDVKLMFETYIHAFEPFQDVSFFFLMCGGAGTGKSMRAKRMMQLLCAGWVMGSGSASQKAGMNGGMDYLCGRLVYYDEITNDYGSSDSERIEYLKSITMEQHVLNTRTVKVAGENGLETFVTVVHDTLHLESHVMCTNCGPLGLRADTEPSSNRAALSDRSWSHIVSPAADNDQVAVDFDLKTASDDTKMQVNQLRVVSCLVAYVLAFIKHIPSCRPNLTYANMLSDQWYEIMWREYNIPKPSKRKKIKLRMMFELFAVESAVYEKFVVPEAGIDFVDMQPDADGHLSPFCIEQLADVVRSLQRCLDQETILNAWSHSLDHSPATCSHVFQMKTLLAQLHGNELDHRKWEKYDLPPAPPAASAADPQQPQQGSPTASNAPQGLAAEPAADDDDRAVQSVNEQEIRAQMRAQPGAAAALAVVSGTGVAPTGAPVGPRVQPQQPQQSQQPQQPNPNYDPPNRMDGTPTMAQAPPTQAMMKEKMKRGDCAALANELSIQRTLRSEMSNRALVKRIDGGFNAHAQLTKLFTDGRDKNKEPMHRMASTGEVISAKRAAGACMPNAADVMSRGMTEGFLRNIVSGLEAKAEECAPGEKMIGTKCNGWEYERISESNNPGPADYDFNWARLKSFAPTQANAAPSDGTAGGPVTVGVPVQRGGASGQNKKSIWTNSAKQIKQASKKANAKTFNIMDAESMTEESMRDTLFMIAQPAQENKMRIPVFNHKRRGSIGDTARMLCKNQIFTESSTPTTLHPNGMFVPHPESGLPMLNPALRYPTGVERPVGLTVGESGYQKRLDHFTLCRALPACIPPESFQKGVPIKEAESFNGIYFNKHIASEQANLVTEIGHYLATIPGIAGGEYKNVPDTFKNSDARTEYNAANRDEHELEESRKAGATASAPPAPPPAPAPPTPPREVRQDTTDWSHIADEDSNSNSNNCDDEDRAEAMRDQEDDQQPQEDALEVEEGNANLGAVRRSVTHPESEGTDINAEEGAADEAAVATAVDEDQDSLPFEWDQFAMFATCKMVDTLHNDCHTYVDGAIAKFKDVFENEDRDATLANLPQICMRFPGIKEKDKGMLFPLSRSIPLTQSRFCDVAKQINSKRPGRELTEAALSFAHGRSIGYHDPEVAQHEAEMRGIDTGFSMVGNLFARSTWQRFTLSALETRGMLSDGEIKRVNDQGLCLRLRVRNHRHVSGHADRDPNLKDCTEATPKSFTAQERYMRAERNNGSNADAHGGPNESIEAKRHKEEKQYNSGLQEEMMGEDMEM